MNDIATNEIVAVLRAMPDHARESPLAIATALWAARVEPPAGASAWSVEACEPLVSLAQMMGQPGA